MQLYSNDSCVCVCVCVCACVHACVCACVHVCVCVCLHTHTHTHTHTHYILTLEDVRMFNSIKQFGSSCKLKQFINIITLGQIN